MIVRVLWGRNSAKKRLVRLIVTEKLKFSEKGGEYWKITRDGEN